MPPPLDHPSLTLSLLDDIYVVRKLDKDVPLPDKMIEFLSRNPNETLVSITKTDEEISVVSSTLMDPGEGLPKWRCIKVRGPMDFGILAWHWPQYLAINNNVLKGLTGVMCDFTTPLKQAGVSIFAISTW